MSEFVPKEKFTAEQIRSVKVAIRANPELGRQLINSAQGGNQDDLQFLLDADLIIFSDSPSESEILEIRED